MKKFLLLLLRLAVSGGLLAMAFRNVNWRLLIDSVRHMSPAWFGAAVFCLLVQQILAAFRWRRIVEACGLAMTISAAIRYSLIAAFFNQTLPASVGGDAARIWLLGRQHANWKAPLYSIVIDRCLGGIALALVVLACLPLAFALIPQQAARLGLIFIGLGCLGAFAAALTAGALPWAWIDRWKATRQARAVARISGKLFFFSWGGLAVLITSILVHLASALAVWCIAQAIGAPLGLGAALVLVPPVMLCAMIPVSIAGWGVRESAMVAILAYAHVASSDGFLISVLFGAAGVLIGMVGGGFWILSGNSGRPPMPVAD
jgi:uncharacterized membrane protein YbhN (UPF0104 family)